MAADESAPILGRWQLLGLSVRQLSLSAAVLFHVLGSAHLLQELRAGGGHSQSDRGAANGAQEQGVLDLIDSRLAPGLTAVDRPSDAV